MLNVTGDENLKDTLGKIQPFRYRGYVYDEETGLYYLRSRYYNLVLCRFISSDFILVSGLITSNQFNYCSNSPIIKTDSCGTSWISDAIHAGKDFLGRFFNTASSGAFLLQMDEENGVYHSRFDCWQQYFGYNDFYDWVFGLGTSMKDKTAEFSCNGKDYAIKMWKGDYLNLGAGAEIGIYSKGGLQWKVEKSLAMDMSMILKYKGETIAQYNARHWWLTSFVPAYQNVNASDLSVSYVITFNNASMYEAFKDKNASWGFDDANLTANYSF